MIALSLISLALISNVEPAFVGTPAPFETALENWGFSEVKEETLLKDLPKATVLFLTESFVVSKPGEGSRIYLSKPREKEQKPIEKFPEDDAAPSEDKTLDFIKSEGSYCYFQLGTVSEILFPPYFWYAGIYEQPKPDEPKADEAKPADSKIMRFVFRLSESLTPFSSLHCVSDQDLKVSDLKVLLPTSMLWVEKTEAAKPNPSMTDKQKTEFQMSPYAIKFDGLKMDQLGTEFNFKEYMDTRSTVRQGFYWGGRYKEVEQNLGPNSKIRIQIYQSDSLSPWSDPWGRRYPYGRYPR